MRANIIPEKTVLEAIRTVEEYPANGVTPGVVKVTVGEVTEDGAFTAAPSKAYMIEGSMYEELVGPPPVWAPDKPTGTYRNDDLWHFIDELRGSTDNA